MKCQQNLISDDFLSNGVGVLEHDDVRQPADQLDLPEGPTDMLRQITNET